MAGRLAEKGLPDQADELCFVSNRIWDEVDPARVRRLLDEAESLL